MKIKERRAMVPRWFRRGEIAGSSLARATAAPPARPQGGGASSEAGPRDGRSNKTQLWFVMASVVTITIAFAVIETW
jgi:hypothetical protein